MFSLAVAIAAVLFGGTSLAADKVEFTDTDGDGVISAEEITAAREVNRSTILAEFDVDGNGELSRDERRAAKDARRAAVETVLDVNGDGELSDEETAGIEQVKEERGEKKSGKRGGRKGGKNCS